MQNLLQKCDVLERLSISQTTLYAMMRTGEFPKPVKIGRRRVFWLQRDIDQYLNDQIDKRDREAVQAGVG
jgi:prophage regulatory protein